MEHTLLSWAAPETSATESVAAARETGSASGNKGSKREHLQLDVPTGITLHSQSTESMELEERLRGPRQPGPRAGCYISWLLARIHIYVFIHAPWLLSVQ